MFVTVFMCDTSFGEPFDVQQCRDPFCLSMLSGVSALIEPTNLLRMRNTALGQSAPALTNSLVSRHCYLAGTFFPFFRLVLVEAA